MSKRNKVLVGVGGAVLLVGIILVSASAKRERGVEVRFAKVGRRDLVAAVTSSGKIQPKKKVDISPDIQGRITQIAVREGDYVTKGQFLLQIDPTLYQSELQRAQAALATAEALALQAKANRDQSQRALGRTKELHQQNPNLVSQEQAEQAQTAFDIAEANLNSATHQVDQSRAAVSSARQNLAKSHIVAPMSGRITRLPVEEGEVAVPGTFSKEVGLLMTIADLSVIQVKVNVDETDVVRVHLADSVEVTIDAFPDTTFIGRVTKISNSAILVAGASTTPGTNTQAVDYEVEITLTNPPGDVRPDLSATARIITDTRKQALSIPIIALTVRENTPVRTEAQGARATGGGGGGGGGGAPLVRRDSAGTKKKESEGVFVVQNGKAAFRPVKVGIAGDEYFEVLDGLRQDETIVAGPYQAIRDLHDGAPVKASQQPADSSRGKKPS
jgi:HlyD family secretion protein